MTGERGLGVAAAGATVGAAASMAVALPLALRSSDAELGWWHDPEGALLFVAVGVVWLAVIAGIGIALAVRGHARPVLTSLAALPMALVVFVVGLVLSIPVLLLVFLVPAATAVLARLVTAPR